MSSLSPQPIPSRPHGHVHVKMSSIDGQKVERCESQQGHGRHEVEVGGVGEPEIPKHDEDQTQHGDTVDGQVQVGLLLAMVVVVVAGSSLFLPSRVVAL